MDNPCRVSADLRVYEAQQDRDDAIQAIADRLIPAIAEEFVCDQGKLGLMLDDEWLAVLADAFANIDKACEGDALSVQAVLRSVAQAKRGTVDIAKGYHAVLDEADSQANDAFNGE